MKRLNFAAKILCTVLVLFMLAQTSAMCVSNALEATKSNDEAVLFLGDVNCDNAINAYDYVLVKRHYFKTFTLVGEQYERADINCDQIVNTYDYILIARHYFNTYVIKQPDLAHKHALALVPAKDKTCTEDGNTAYYVCNGCDKIFADEQGEIEISLESTVIAKGHNEVTVPGYPASYESEGLTSGVQCSVCQEWIEEQEVIEKLEATEHKLTFFDDKTAGYPKYESYYEHLGVDSLPTLELEGYNFLGWFDDSGKQVKFIPKNSTEDYLLYANWDAIEYTITYFDAGEHTNTTSYTIEDEIILTDPEWTGLRFDRWVEKDNKITAYYETNGAYRAKIEKGTTGNLELTAHWLYQENMAVPSNDTTAKTIFYDEETNRYYFVYDLGIIDNIVLKKVESVDKEKGAFITWETSETVTISTELADSVASSVSYSVSHTNESSELTKAVTSHTDQTETSVELNAYDVLKIQGKISNTDYSENSFEFGKTDSETSGSESSDSVSSTFICSKGSSVTVTTTTGVTENMPKGTYHNCAVAKVQVYAVVTYDPEKNEYYLDTHNVLVETRRKILYEAPSDSKANIEYSSGLPFNVPLFEKDEEGNLKTDENGKYIPGDIINYLNNVYYVNYNANGGNGNMLNTAHKLGESGKLAKNEYTRDGYVFLGWGTSENGAPTYTDEEEILNLCDGGEKITLYAIWEIIPYTAIWNDVAHCTITVKRTASPNGNASIGNISGGATIYYGDKLEISYTAENGYHIVNHGITGKTVTGDVGNDMIYVTVAKNTYNLAFNANGGEGKMGTISNIPFDQVTTLTTNRFTRHGWTFVGWNTKADGSGVPISDGAPVSHLRMDHNQTTTLYAQWKIKTGFSINYQDFSVKKSGSARTWTSTINLNDYVDLNSLKAAGYTKITVVQKFRAAKTSDDGGYVIGNLFFDNGDGELWDNSASDVSIAYTNLHYFAPDSYNANLQWTNTRNIGDHTAFVFKITTYNPWFVLFDDYKCAYDVSNYELIVSFS